MTSRVGLAAAIVLVLAPALLAAVAVDAHARRGRREAVDHAVLAVARRLPAADLALSGGARWQRMPSLEEPGAAFADGPAVPDADPAGGAMAPPREAWAAEARAR